VFTRFFIDRPIFASVLSIIITLAGGIAVWTLPIAQYPQITPPTIQVDCNYPGASAEVVAETVAAPIEQQVNGVEDMLYMSSACTNDGSYTLTVTFKLGVQLNFAQVLVQNRVNLALPNLPDVVKATGVITRKRSADILLVASIISPHGRYDQLYLSNFALTRIRDELSRVRGVGDVIMFGQRDYSMRIWLDPERMSVRNVSASDVVLALREQNQQVAAGQVGQPPTGSTSTQFVVNTVGRLRDIEEFEDIIVKRGARGQVIRIRDIGHVTLGARNEDISNRFGSTKFKTEDGEEKSRPGCGIAIFQLSDANALETADRVRAKLEELKKDFPEDVDYQIGYDTTPFIRESIYEVFKSLQDAILLVAIVVLVFLQNWRSAVIPLVAVPVAIIGTFAVMAAVGFSLNNLTLFGLVLAIGIVVDDAIVVVEAVEHHIEHGMSPRDATIRAMDEVSGPVIAVGLVLSAVFVPCAFIGGIIGQFFRQFALTIAISTLISAFNSLTLSPALAALLLKRKEKSDRPLPWLAFLAVGAWLGYASLGHRLRGWAQGFDQEGLPDWAFSVVGAALAAGVGVLLSGLLNRLLAGFFRLFNRAFMLGTSIYTRVVGMTLRVSLLVLVVYGGLLYLTYWSFGQLPRGFIPTQDKGYLLASIQLPDAASVGRTKDAIRKIEKVILNTKGVAFTTSVAGNSFLLSAYGSNFGSMFFILDPFDERRDPSLTADAILTKLRKDLATEVPEATMAIFGPPPVNGLGKAGGFRFMVEDRGEGSLRDLQKATEDLVERMNQESDLTASFTVFRANSPMLYFAANRPACLQKGVDLAEVNTTLQVFLGSQYVNDFNRFGRTWQVVVQADEKFRRKAEDVGKLKVRNNRGDMVPLGTVATVKEQNGPLVLTRYNMYTSAAINGGSAEGVSSGDTINLVSKLAEQELPSSMSGEWTEIFYLEKISGNTGMILFGFSVVFVFLVLAAQYESWSLPLAVILVVPLCVLSSLAGVAVRKHDINIFTQVGFVVLIGLACKNAILIVEFAKHKREQGANGREAALAACELRLRPILMTSFAFILGVVPLVFAHGAGAEMREVLGTAVFAGMLGVTAFGIFLTPVFFVLVDRIGHLWLFATPAYERFSTLSMDILRGRYLGRGAAALWQRFGSRRR
jgi:multidrug efflux pump